MDSLITAFGINTKILTIQIVNFTLMAVILGRLLYKPVLRLLREREEQITRGIADAQTASEERARAEKERIAILTKAEHEAHETVARGVVSANEKAYIIMENAETKTVEMIRSAETRGAEIIANAVKESEAEIAKLAVLELEKKLSA